MVKKIKFNKKDYMKEYRQTHKKEISASQRERRAKRGYKLPQRIKKVFDVKISCYFAGLLDGEGCVMIGKYDIKGQERYRAFIMIGNTDERIVIWLKKKIGGNYYLQKKIKPQKNAYIWSVCMKEGTNILKQCLPYLVLKNKQAKIYLKFANTQYLGGWKLGVQGLTTKILKKRKKLFLENKKLNKKGR